MAQSTNDVMPTAMRLCTITKAKKLVSALEELVATFEAKGDSFQTRFENGTYSFARCCANYIRSRVFYAYAEATKRGIKRISENVKNMHVVNMGATAVGTGLNAEPEYIKFVVEELSRLYRREKLNRLITW